MKSHTDLKQSKELVKILPLESADMYYALSEDESMNMINFGKPQGFFDKTQVAWSFAALFGILTGNKICHYDDRYYCQYMSEGDEFPIYSTAEYNNPIDACVEMIEKLHELKML